MFFLLYHSTNSILLSRICEFVGESNWCKDIYNQGVKLLENPIKSAKDLLMEFKKGQKGIQ